MNALSLRRDPIRLALSKAPWSGSWYLLSYLFTGTALFAVALTAVLSGAVLGFTLAGLPVLVAAAVAVRWCADVERATLRPLCPVQGGYREVTGSGVLAQLRTRWQDPATWRDIAYLLGMFVPLFALDLAVLTICLGMAFLPKPGDPAPRHFGPQARTYVHTALAASEVPQLLVCE